MTRTTKVDYLRVSVTDRCNLRCIYCNPLGVERLVDHTEILGIDEIHRIVTLCARFGITRVRLTGGEPLVRRDIVQLVERLASISGLTDLCLTTNGVLLAPMAVALKTAGLQRVNVSFDAVDRSCFHKMTGCDELAQVTSGVQRAIEIGMTPVRINCVVLRAVNLFQVPRLAQMTIHLPVSVRFIEYCPPGMRGGESHWYVASDEVRSLVESALGVLSPVKSARAGGPAVYFRAPGAAGMIGFISGRSSRFCHQCSRLRLTCDGKLKPCLHCAKQYDFKSLLRSGADDSALLDLIGRAFQEKIRYTKLSGTSARFSMQLVGG